ncbi:MULTISPECIES: hypothetical protein [unclassified Caballeronia]|uniref:hypothetical protein n=1 Tax=unclassified Caballeronia TaxID=2646786 RepID=UPI0020297DF3|nr:MULTISPECIES: hypothetical protein [unclassified Caballeronia]
MNACQQELSEPVTDYESTQTTHARELSIAISKARIIPGSPGKVTFAVENRCDWDFEVVSSAFEIKCTKIGARHALPKAGWGYAVTDAVRPATLLPARSELWTTFEADKRTTFRGAVPSTAPSSFEPQYYFSGHLLYRRFRGELLETSVYRRLAYPELECWIIEPNDAGLKKEGRVVFASV